ncbi:MAG TPA: response regulator [Nannocystis sp.]
MHEPETEPRGATILVVDDNAANRALAQECLEDEGYTVVLAQDGQQALALFAETRPDCVILDVRMPGLDGFAVCERIRALPRGQDTPILFLTALRDVDTFDRAAMVGGDDFLTKPVRPAELLVRVQTALRVRQLGSERRELFEEVRRQRDAMTRLQLQREMLMAFVVHDLKNPVGAMSLSAELILRDKQIGPAAREAARQIQSVAQGLLRLIHNLLDLSRSEEGKLVVNRAETDLGALIAEVLTEMEVRATAAEVALRVRGEAPPLPLDGDLIRRTLANLIDNAIRHAPAESEVWVDLRPGERSIEIRVADAGPGVPPALRERIFERFVQLEAGAHGSRGGRGLGLAFCKLAVEAHGGRIWVEDSNPGAVLCMELPRE